MASKAVIRDVGRVLDMPYNFCDQLSKLIPVVQNKPVAARRRARRSRCLPNARTTRKRCANCSSWPSRSRADAQRRHARRRRADRAGQAHRLLPALPADGTTRPVSQFDKDDVEAVGLVKFDFLGLRNLTIIDWRCATSSASTRRSIRST
jgi:DNA polymerase-3 subunit alpha